MNGKSICISKTEVVTTFLLAIYFCVCLLLMDRISGLIDWLGIFIFIYSVYTWKKKTGSGWFNPYTILQLFMVMFNYGQPIMWALGIHRETEIGMHTLYTSYIPTQKDLLEAQMYTCLAMLLFHFGAISLAKRKDVNIKLIAKKRRLNDDDIKKAMRTVCGMLLVFVAPIAIVYRWYEVQIARTYGYIALYYGSHNTQNGYIQILLYLFFPALVGYLIGSNYSRKSRYIAYGIFGIYAVLGMLSGDRGGWIYSLVILLWMHTFYKRTPFRTYIIYGIAGIIGIYILSVFVSVRDSGLVVTGNDILRIFRSENSPIVDVFFEMGGTMGLIIYFLNKGNRIFPYGNTYLTSILGMVSSRILNFLGIHQVLLANWFSQEYLGISWGTGFSMIAEAYVNGGYIGGLIYMFILGCVHGKLLSFSGKISSDSSPLKMFVVIAGLNAIIGFIREALYLTLKELFYGVFVPFLLIKLLVLIRRRNN